MSALAHEGREPRRAEAPPPQLRRKGSPPDGTVPPLLGPTPRPAAQYLVLASGTDPHALGDRLQRWV